MAIPGNIKNLTDNVIRISITLNMIFQKRNPLNVPRVVK